MMMMGIYKNAIYNCKQATFLIEKKALGSITLKDRLQLFIHLKGCDVCKLYKKQSHMIDLMVRKLFKEAGGKHPDLDEAYKRELQLRIEEELNRN